MDRTATTSALAAAGLPRVVLLLDDCCVSWERTSTDAGTTVRFVLPFDAGR